MRLLRNGFRSTAFRNRLLLQHFCKSYGNLRKGRTEDRSAIQMAVEVWIEDVATTICQWKYLSFEPEI